MKLHFTPSELAWLNYHVDRVIVLTAKRSEPKSELMARTAARMRYKFTPNAQTVYLNGNERALLVTLCGYRAAHMPDNPLSVEEAPVVRGILTKLGGQS